MHLNYCKQQKKKAKALSEIKHWQQIITDKLMCHSRLDKLVLICSISVDAHNQVS